VGLSYRQYLQEQHSIELPQKNGGAMFHSSQRRIGELRTGLTVIAVVLLSGCSALPVATNHVLSGQEKLRSVAHWHLLATSTAQAIATDLSYVGNHSMCNSTADTACLLAVQPAGTRSDFSQAFDSFLVSALFDECRTGATQKKVAVKCEVSPSFDEEAPAGSAAAANGIVIRYGIQRVVHRDMVAHNPPAGLFSLLGTGVWLGHQASTHWSGGDPYHAAIPAGIALDLLTGALATPTNTEIIVSVQATSAGTMVFRHDSSYYVDDADADEYPSSPLIVSSGRPNEAEKVHVGLSP
jgi:hypothetical protein